VQLPTEQFLRKRYVTAPDLVVVDPPRAGLGGKVTAGLVQMAPGKVVYVSCDPATLARDLRVLKDAGYLIDELHMVDLFPQTYHLESVVKLSRS
jgi:23S rRNA (uracil1939-C5)-methyltransferase